MKVIVTEMPNDPIKCLFSSYNAKYDVCECILSHNGSYECEDCSKCPYLISLKDYFTELSIFTEVSID